MGSEKTQFKPGQSGNPAGGPKQDPVIKTAKHFDKYNYDRINHWLANTSVEDIRAFVQSGKGTGLEMALATGWLKAISKGDIKSFELLTDRMIGTTVKHVNVTGKSFADIMAEAEKAKPDEPVSEG